jgi:DNA-binding MarR family transcriptional regulator
MHRYDAGRTLPILHAAKLTTPQLAVLGFTCEPRTVSAVAIYLGLSKPATSQLIDKLVRSHLVLRIQSKLDRRERTVIIGTKGKTLLARIAVARAARFDASLAVLPPAVASKLELILAEIVDALGRAVPQDSIRPTTRSSRSRNR